MHKPKLFKYIDDKDNAYYELAWFTNYNTKNQELHTKIFDTVNEAKEFCK